MIFQYKNDLCSIGKFIFIFINLEYFYHNTNLPQICCAIFPLVFSWYALMWCVLFCACFLLTVIFLSFVWCNMFKLSSSLLQHLVLFVCSKVQTASLTGLHFITHLKICLLFSMLVFFIVPADTSLVEAMFMSALILLLTLL